MLSAFIAKTATKLHERYEKEPIPFGLNAGVTMWSTDNYSEIMSKDEKSAISGIYFENITVDGEICDLDVLGVKIGNRVGEICCDKYKVR